MVKNISRALLIIPAKLNKNKENIPIPAKPVKYGRYFSLFHLYNFHTIKQRHTIRHTEAIKAKTI
jgi:hypothetical protein